jgi:phosphatidylserine/phosphatidylglycerophosphate/cardiolipin synthase-like enzyme
MTMNKLSPETKVTVSLLCGIVFLAAAAFAASPEKSARNPSSGRQSVILTNEDYFPALLEAIDNAQKEILISMFSFKAGDHKNSYPDRITAHLAGAIKRGVNVIVVLERPGNKSDELGRQNIQTGKILEAKGIRVFFDSPNKTTHTKLVVIDEHLVFLGSHNFTQSALKYNNEVSILLDRPDLAQNVRDYILKIIREAK